MPKEMKCLGEKVTPHSKIELFALNHKVTNYSHIQPFLKEWTARFRTKTEEAGAKQE